MLRILLLGVMLLAAASGQDEKPNIFLIVVDDLGAFDVSFRGSEIETPTIDEFCKSGLILDRLYTDSWSAQSRGALMTGKYAIHLGLQNGLTSGQRGGLPLDMKTLANVLDDLGYDTAMLGKWQLGFSSREYTPTYRGFDTFYGLYQANGDYFIHTHFSKAMNNSYGLDFHDGLNPVYHQGGKFSSDVYDAVFDNLVDNKDDDPMFVYYAHQLPGMGTEIRPMVTASSYIPPMTNDQRRIQYASMVKYLDDSFNNTLNTLKENDLYDDSIIIFMSDNGAAPDDMDDTGGSNYPLRGGKGTTYEGGIRATTACMMAPHLKNKESISFQLMHIADWFPTLISAAGGDLSEFEDLDGIDMWDALTESEESPRDHVFVHDPEGMSVYIDGKTNLKLVMAAEDYDDQYRDQIKPYGVPDSYHAYTEDDPLDPPPSGTTQLPQNFQRNALLLQCGEEPRRNRNKCQKLPCLFNLTADPCELTDLSSSETRLQDQLLAAFDEIKDTAVEPLEEGDDPAAAPRYHRGNWEPWVELNPAPLQNCDDTCYINKKVCGDVPEVKYAYTDATTFTVGSEVTYNCFKGWTIKGLATIKCGEDYSWGTPPECI